MSAPSASTFVPRNQRERLMLVFAETVYRQGFALTRLSDVARRADVDVGEVTRRWETEEACAAEIVDLCAQQTFSRVADAYVSTVGDCPYAAHRALGAFLDHVAGMPALLRLAVVDYPDLSPAARRRTKGYLDLFAEFLGPGFTALDFEPPDPAVVSMLIGGGILGVLRQHALEGRIERLPAALPAVSYVCISTFFGIDEARRILELARLDASTDSTQ